MATPDNIGQSVPIPIFNGTTTHLRQWQIAIRDYAFQLELHDFLIQGLVYPNGVDVVALENERPVFRPLQKPNFPLSTSTAAQIKFYDLQEKAYEKQRSRIFALRVKIVSSISPDVYHDLFTTEYSRINAGLDDIFTLLDKKFGLETAADIALEAHLVLKGIEHGNFEEFMARQKRFIERRRQAEMPLTDAQQVQRDTTPTSRSAMSFHSFA